ncbi:MAG: aspartate ammonia-lyase [Phycisphaerae bacterium]|jgi:aspartate ammonia-lyase
MAACREERDLLGVLPLPQDALFGIHTQRAIDNFPITGRRVHPALIHAYGQVKLACTLTNQELGCLDDARAAAIAAACIEMSDGKLDAHLLVDALQGGAGTSTNMNVNEVLANRALQVLGRPTGDYDAIHPLDHVNLHQSTNDTYPTALRIAAIVLLHRLEHEVVALQEAFQRKEKQFAHVVKVARTQLQDAVLTTLGREMSAYAEALARDRWRIYKCEERLRVVNLGGTAIGTGLAAPRQYIFRVVERLREVTGFGLARAENLIDATQNNDVFVEVSGILKSCASNLLKIATDLRLMSSGPDAGLAEIRLPPRQAGSSIMPGKVNPVIPEAVSQAALLCIAYDQAVTNACSLGNLELNPFLPLVADALLGSLSLLTNACDVFRRLCVDGIEADQAACRRHVEGATATLTALVGRIGYERAQTVGRQSRRDGRTIRETAIALGFLTAAEFDELVSPEAVCRLGSP